MATSLGTVQMAAALPAITGLSRAELINRWIADHDRAPPKGISRRLLEYSAAYKMQVSAYGGLKPAIRRKLRPIVTGGAEAGTSVIPPKAKTLQPGARLVREWRGRTYTVDTLDDGFIYDGEHYASLTKIARAITGARWSGPRFFGL